MIMKTIKISEKGQIALPKDIRKKAHLNKGDTLIIIEQNGKLLLEKSQGLTPHFKDDFQDLLKHSENVAHKLWGTKSDDIWDTL